VRLFVLDYGTFHIDLDTLIPGDGNGEWITIGIPGYLIETDDGRRMLVDTGLPGAYYDDPLAAAQADNYDNWVTVHVTDENRPAGQLAKIGLKPEDITHVVVTHTHFDHAGGLHDFPNAVHLIQRAEIENRKPAYFGFSWPERVEFQLLDGDAEIGVGIQLLSTPGHTPGHMSIALELPNTGKLLLAIDAIYLSRSAELDNFNAAWSRTKSRASGHRVLDLAASSGARLLYGHDPEQWATLKKAPAFYD
jgi:N-acyl homoserine lactone hydrolase